ncbi:uncharacterized protein ASPGLDRAFT_41272 [Aspergillus glaucus CBS 516.65]|uniref:Uncharacterized protein n=1 Tax=Aspergillus glaucus CBS 516.65 TaxID=1160497 RepID=A0A1L9VZH1_ASPGL|nr:hypothetical protein ASPGLDRAFT_41272 [Aspergillus glaucus CBS 516.65]OJJ89311.1 hypothetical protein ASPGLDRAFT_41272 [Aspergillus glaucus CBS 516.65]
MVDFGPPHGFALRRRGSCLENESGNVTWGEFSRCCPKPSIDESGACCPTANNCMEDIKNPAHCADESWLLFRNTRDNGYFCCLPKTDGFLTIFNDNTTGVGCRDSTDPETSDYLWQPRVITDADGSTCPSTSKSGAIAGGVVGGVVGLAIILALLWYFMRRLSQKQPPQEEMPITEAPVIQSGPVMSSGKPRGLDCPGYMAELENIPVHELPENIRT